MMSLKRKLKILFVLLMIPILYAGLYLVMVEKHVAWAKTAHITVKRTHPVYRILNYDLTRKFFYPAYYVDRKLIRKVYWESTN